MSRAFSTPSTVTWNFLILSCVALREWLIGGSAGDGRCSWGPFTPEKCGDEFVPSFECLQPYPPQSYSAAGLCGSDLMTYTRNHWLSPPGPLNTAQPEFLCCKTKLLMLFYIMFLYIHGHVSCHVCISMRPMVLSMICLIYGWDTHH